jgi:hypothetical protein
MESHISSIIRTDSTSGTLKPQLVISDPTRIKRSTSQTLLESSAIASTHGGVSSSPGFVSQQTPNLPSAEEMLAAQQPKKRILTLTYEELYQWQQILGKFKKNMKESLDRN